MLRHRLFRIASISRKAKRKHFLAGAYPFDVQGVFAGYWLTQLTPDLEQALRIPQLRGRVLEKLRELKVDEIEIAKLERLATALEVEWSNLKEEETKLW